MYKIHFLFLTNHNYFTGTNIQVFAVHPGGVQSNLARHVVDVWYASKLMAILWKNTVEGTQTTLHCALEAIQEDPYYYRCVYIHMLVLLTRKYSKIKSFSLL